MFKLVGTDMLNSSTPETFLHDPPVTDSGHIACPLNIGFKISVPILNKMCEFRKMLRRRHLQFNSVGLFMCEYHQKKTSHFKMTHNHGVHK
jgi:hypothetical protein